MTTGSRAATETDPAIRVLIVDDHVVFAESLARALATEPGIEVSATASSAVSATEYAASLQPDVVLLDFLLPDVRGGEAAAAILAACPTTRIVVVTGLSDGSALPTSLAAGCIGYVSKTDGLADVVAAIRAAASGHAPISPELLAAALPTLRGTTDRGLGDLSVRELEVLQLLAAGVANRDIARELDISMHTVRNHVQRILVKLDAHSKLEAVAVAARRNLIVRQ